MQCQWIDRQPSNVSHSLEDRRVYFYTHFQGYMEMYSDPDTTATYLQAHEGWFCRCAEPMKTEPIGNNGYILTVGRFGNFGYEVEPKMAVVLDPPVEGIYHMRSIPLPDEPNLGYELDYHASMQLKEIPIKLAGKGLEKAYDQAGCHQLPETITKIEWTLKMEVAVQFPQFVYRLPLSLTQSAGDRLLGQIIRQVSPRLSSKVQKDFHSLHQLPLPPKSSRDLVRIDQGDSAEREQVA